MYLLFRDDKVLHRLGGFEDLDLLDDVDHGTNDHSLVNPAITC